MKYLLVLCCVVGAVVCETYTSEYDTTNIDEVLASKRLVTNYFACIMKRGPCTKEGKTLQETLPDALQTKCSKCTKAQQDGATKVIDHLIKNEPEMWKELCEKFDPEGKYRKEYEEEARARGIVIPN